jgi:predicted dehydrogenase
MSRKRGRLVLVGVTGLNLSRDLFYKKELSFTVSCSYGPGRYDPAYEEGGQDYPPAFVRWTEQRNFEAVLDLMASGVLDPRPVVSHRFPFEKASSAYDLISGREPSLGVLLTYPDRGGVAPPATAQVVTRGVRGGQTRGVLGVLGAGNFAVRTLLPALRSAGFRFHTVVSSGSISGPVAGEKFAFERVATDPQAVLEDPEIDAVVVLTRHDSHAEFARRALEAGKHVFVEKPLALTEAELDAIAEAAGRSGGTLMVGFNRRFAPLTERARRLLRGRAGPLSVIATMNAGSTPRDHWTQDPAIGGGRIVGEACHMIDLARALVGSPIVDLDVVVARNHQGSPIDDIAHLGLRFADGSTAVVNYLASGSRAYPKERVECFFDGKTLMVDNWRRLRTFGLPSSLLSWPSKMDKGHSAEIVAWIRSVRDGGPAPIPLEELLEVSRWSIRAGQAARLGSE